LDFPPIYKEIAEVAAEYSYNKPPELLLTLQRLARSLLRLLSDLLASAHIPLGNATDSRAMSNLLLVAVIALGSICFVLVVVAIVARARHWKGKQKRSKLGADVTAMLLSAEAWRQEADRLAGEKQWKEACRASYFSFLRELDEKGVLPFSPTRSNYEYYYALLRKSDLAIVFRRLADLVEEEWFGNRIAGEADYKECQTLALQATRLQDKNQSDTTSQS
jgi:hypothetical protein